LEPRIQSHKRVRAVATEQSRGSGGSRIAGTPGKSTSDALAFRNLLLELLDPIGSGYQPLFADVEKRMEADGILAPILAIGFSREAESIS